MQYATAVDELYQAPLDAFVAERKRLAAAVKAAGDKAGAAQLAKLPRPPASAWVVNQLWWHARAAFDAMLATAARLRAGEVGATAEHRAAIADLRARAGRLLTDAGHGATEAVLRRVTTTLAALAVDGGFGADRPGALAADRESPGFAAAGVTAVPESAAPVPAPVVVPKAAAPRDDDGAAARAAAAAAERAAHVAREQERARRAAQRHKLDAAIQAAKADITFAERDVARLEAELADARGRLEQGRALAEDLVEKRAALAE